jgi:hypothetical protein
MTPAHQFAAELLLKEPQHPLLPLPTVDDIAATLLKPDGAKFVGESLDFRRKIIWKANADPLRNELEPSFWQDVRKAMADRIKVVILLGGNRSGKSRNCGKLTVEALVNNPGTLIVCVSEDETASIETQQRIIWHYLPPEIKLNCHNRRDPRGIFYVNYSEANGFSERKLVLPLPKGHVGNPSKLLFATYNENADDYEGLEFGHPTAWTVGWWADENLRLNWLQMFTRRGKFRPGSGLWSYTPIHGITPTIKEAVGKSAVTLEHRPAALLQDRINVPGLPAGTMPYIQHGALPNSRVFYFHSEMSPFGPGPNGSGKPYAQSVAEDCKGKPSEYIQRIAYGYTEDVIGLCYPKFRGDVHVVKPQNLPEQGTNYVFIDPAGDRNWFMLWVRVPPGSPRRVYIYREWPDLRRYGEWAVASGKAVTAESKKGWDGDRGPAQRNQGWGVVRYKKLMLEEETIRMELNPDGDWAEPDPYRRAILDKAMKSKQKMEDGRWKLEDVEEVRKQLADPLREVIRQRKVDPRAAKNPQASAVGGTNILTLFANEDKDSRGVVVAGRMIVMEAYTGKGIDDGIAHVNELLDYKEQEPLCPVLNEPKLYVSSECKNLIWMFENYTNQGGEDAGCKDPADLARYIAQDSDMRFIDGTGKLVTGGFKEGF